MSQPALGVLLVSGAQTHQENYAAQFREDSRCRLVGLTDEINVSSERAKLNQAYAEQMQIPYIPDLGEALSSGDVDLVSVCAEPERRGRIVLTCAQAGKHVYIDKPMTPYLPVADQIVVEVERRGLRTQMYSSVHQAWAQRAKRVVDSGELGELVAVHADNLFAKGPAGSATLGRPRQAPYPPIISNFVDAKAELYAMSIYALGLILWLTARTVETVYGRTANYFFQAHQQHDVEDFGFLLLTLKGGINATVTGGRIGWTGHGGEGTNQMYLIGTKGAMLVDAYAPRIEVYDSAPPWLPPPVNPEDPMGFWRSTQEAVHMQPKRVYQPLTNAIAARSDEHHFIDAIVKGKEATVNADVAAKLTEILLAGYKSASSGKVITLPMPREES